MSALPPKATEIADIAGAVARGGLQCTFRRITTNLTCEHKCLLLAQSAAIVTRADQLRLNGRPYLCSITEKISPVRVAPTARTSEKIPTNIRVMIFGFEELSIASKIRA